MGQIASEYLHKQHLAEDGRICRNCGMYWTKEEIFHKERYIEYINYTRWNTD